MVLLFGCVALVLIAIGIYALYKIKNIRIFLVTFSLPLIFIFINNQRLCTLEPLSEACTWAYLGYIPAFFIGIILYLLACIIQVRFKNKVESETTE